MFKKFVASIIVLPFLIVPLFCCCVKQAQAETEVEHCHDVDSDHSATHNHADHDSSHSCDCHSLSTAAENASTIHISLSSFPNVFPVGDFVSVKPAPYLKDLLSLAYLGPPISGSSAVPLYTLYHSLRI